MKYVIAAIALLFIAEDQALACRPDEIRPCQLDGCAHAQQECGYGGQWGPCECLDPPPDLFLAENHGRGCGWVNGAWNVPYGAAVLTRSSSGPIRGVIDAIGEHYTHSMLSLGNQGVIQAEMRLPNTQGWPSVCTVPLIPDELQNGRPGVSQVNLGAAYSDIYNGMYEIVYKYGDPNTMSNIANAIYYADGVVEPSESGDQFRGPAAILKKFRNGIKIPYSFYQYRDIQQTNQLPSWSSNGMVCSTFLSWAHVSGGAGIIQAYQYTHPLIANAANILHGRVWDECSNQLGFWGGFGSFLACFGHNVCANMGDQVTNCMALNICNDNNDRLWQGVRDDGQTTAFSISPDRIAGRDPHGPGTSAWSDDYEHGVYWSVGGEQYGCWY